MNGMDLFYLFLHKHTNADIQMKLHIVSVECVHTEQS